MLKTAHNTSYQFDIAQYKPIQISHAKHYKNYTKQIDITQAKN